MPLEQAHQYLARVIAWPQEGEDAFANLHWTYHKPEYDKPRWGGRAVRTLKEAINALEFALRDVHTRDVYVCLSTQRVAQPHTGRNGYKFYTPVRSAENAVALKTLFLDIDIGEDKAKNKQGYATLPDAIGALTAFITATGLPKPTVLVLSGGGLHVYWTLARALTRNEWLPLAYALKEACARHALLCDEKVTSDSARILRVPDTLNRKQETPRKVRLGGTPSDLSYSVEKLESLLEPYKVTVPQLANALDPVLFPPRAPVKGEDELSAGIDSSMGHAELKAILAALPNNKVDWNWWNTVGMRVYAASAGADYGLDEWKTWSAQNGNAGAKDSCEERWATFHHSPPTRTGAGALINEVRAVLGNPKWLPQLAPPAAQGVPVIGATMPPVPAPQNDLPDTYVRRADGIVVRRVVTDAGSFEEVPVSTYKLEEPWLQDEPKILHFKTTVDRGRNRQVDLPLENIGTTDMRKLLQGQGMMLPTGKKLELFTEFLMSWVKKLQETRDSVASSPFGWSTKGGKVEGFVYANRLWTPSGSSPSASPDSVIARQYSPVGDAQAWVDAVKLVTLQGRPELEALVATAFGAPLVRFTGQPGVLMSAYSTASGIGKTTALKIAQAVWGDPIKAIQSLSDTQNSVMGKLGELRSLPLYWDELKTEEDTKKFVNITFQTTQGKEKSRMTQQARQREPGSWQTLLVSASNDSLLDYVLSATNMTTAGLYRIFEYKMDRPTAPSVVDTSDASRIVAKLHDNFGLVGEEYARFLGAHHAQCEQDVATFLRDVGREVNTISDERYWLALIAVICIGARYCNHLGFAQFDLDGIKAFLLGVLKDMRGQREAQPVDMEKEINVTTILGQFLKAMRGRSTLITNRIIVTPGRTPAGAVTVLHGTGATVQDIQVHYGADDKLLRFSSTRFSEWLKDKGLSRHLFTQALEKELGCRHVMGRLGGGTPHRSIMTEHLLEIQLAGTALADSMEVKDAAK
jgi:hypothetical protein